MNLWENSEVELRRDSENRFSVRIAGKAVGTLEVYTNEFHGQNQYVRLRLTEYDARLAAPLFARLQAAVGRPLQVMLPSGETEQAAFLMAGGFERKRRCYELEVTAAELVGAESAVPLKTAQRAQPEYDRCCRLLFERYQQNHAAVNPLTADFAPFCAALPAKALYQETAGQIVHAAFVEGNEIAYLTGADETGVRPFAAAIVAALFAEHETICFECDDCDGAAMALKGLFRVGEQETFDTYVRGVDGLSLTEYRADPCRAASIPYWKAVRTEIPAHMCIVHRKDFSPALLDGYIDEPYFRLKHDLLRVERPRLPEGFALCGATCREYAEHINGCYPDLGVSEEELQGYTRREVYDPDLWLAVRDSGSGKIVATGIGELDRSVGEGVLEWIQVSPEYRGKGLGKFLVLELLERMRPAAEFATVSGKCSAPTSPERLYRRCGFAGSDVWHVLRRK